MCYVFIELLRFSSIAWSSTHPVLELVVDVLDTDLARRVHNHSHLAGGFEDRRHEVLDYKC